MKKIYLSLFIGIGLALATKNSFAKPTHSVIKKQGHVSSKTSKIHSKLAASSKKRITSTVLLNNRHPKKVPIQNPVLTEVTSPLIISGENKGFITPPPQDEHQISELATENRVHSLIVPHKNEAPSLSKNETEYRHFFSAQGIIDSSLVHAGVKAGLTNELIMQLTNIFAWDIDFATNIQNGDQFTVVYEKSDTSSEKIMAAEFVTGGKTYTAIRYRDSEGQINYYSPEGKPMRKAFLSTPVDYVRISSGFDVHRKHPILNRIRAHKGVDYAARTGTPVKAAGEGKITFLGRKGGYGQVIILEHDEHYETLYAHLSDFKKDLQSGDHVEQGQIIGYVGQSGLATGPHLHYEFRVNGVHHNPESLNQQHSLPLSDERLAEFKSQSRPLLAQLYQIKASNLLAKSGLTPYH